MAANAGVGVPLCDLQAQYRELQPRVGGGPGARAGFRPGHSRPGGRRPGAEVAGYCGVGYGVGCGSGTDALSLALHALEIGPGDEVILPTFTFFATAGSICRTGARPVFVRHRPGHLQPRSAAGREQDHAAHARHPGRPSVRPVRRHGAAVAHRRAARSARHRGRRPGARRGIPGQTRRQSRQSRLPELLSDQEPRRLRRRRHGRDQRSGVGRAA